MGYREHLKTKRADEGKLDILMAIARNNPHQEGFLQRLEQLETLARDGRGEAGGVVLSTIHAREDLPWVMAPLIFCATLLTHLFGGSAGREGAALQLGGSTASMLAKMLKSLRLG